MLEEIVSAHGMYLHTGDGRSIMDLIAGIGVSSLGHTHASVVDAVQDQASRYMHTMVYGEFVLSPQVLLAQTLANLLPNPLDSTYFVNSGSEAVEGAMKLAKKVTGRFEIVACTKAYHGSTQGSMSLQSDDYFTRPFRPLLPEIKFIDYNCVAHLDHITEQTAAVVMETVQAEIGLQVPEGQYLQRVADRCHEVGALLILDEIQAAMGRTGHLFAFSAFDICPDILLLAKGLGGGMPIGAFVAAKAHMDQLASEPVLGHITTFGGHPVNCAAALATLKVLQESDLIDLVPVKSQSFLELLPHPAIKEIRTCGLWFALQLESKEKLRKAVDLGLKEGLLFDWFLYDECSIRLAPPLIISKEEIKMACNKLHRVLDKI
ncbi:MAG: aspartate aminotransferase family protein [Saprospiraceae bacterium]|nr:aspartate aminotransferase family protein [Saprospiraceae bacterium]